MSKSRLTMGKQCPKRLWLYVNKPELVTQDTGRESRFAQGHQVGELARILYGPGTLIGDPSQVKASLDRTHELLAGGGDIVLFEAAFEHEGILVFTDIVRRLAGQLELIEVKSTTHAKDYHYLDAAIQTWVMTAAGYAPKRTAVAHINSTFVYQTLGDYIGLLAEVDVTNQMQALIPTLPDLLGRLRATLSGSEPTLAMGDHCSAPFDCEFQEYCRSLLGPQPEYPVDILPRGGKAVRELKSAGIYDIFDVPPEWPLKPNHRMLVNATQTGIPWRDEAELSKIDAIPYPRAYLDFEGIQFAIPRWLGTRPYQQLPFQWSCHVEFEDGRVEQHGFLDTDGTGDFSRLAEAMIAAIPSGVPVLVYNASYEKQILSFLADACPALAPLLMALRDQVVDLLPIVRAGWYHPSLGGSFSLKKVLPSLAPEMDYNALDGVADGGQAQEAYLQLIQSLEEQDRKRLITELERYCAMDTEGLMTVARKLARSRQNRTAPG